MTKDREFRLLAENFTDRTSMNRSMRGILNPARGVDPERGISREGSPNDSPRNGGNSPQNSDNSPQNGPETFTGNFPEDSFNLDGL